MTRQEFEQERLQLKADTAALAFKLRLIAATAGVEVKAYNPNQPRAPKGRTDGGQWVDAGGGSGTATAGKKKPPRPDASTRTQEIVETLKETPTANADLETVDIQLDGSVFDEAVSEEDQFDVASREGGDAWRLSPSTLSASIWKGAAADLDRHSEEVQNILADKPEILVRAYGAILAVEGVATTGIGKTIGVAAGAGKGRIPRHITRLAIPFSIWMVGKGYDDYSTGLRNFLTGEPGETAINQTLKGWGLSDDQIAAMELTFAAYSLGTAAVGTLSTGALRRAARDGLQRKALADLAVKPLTVLHDGKSIWKSPDIVVRGKAWEAYDAGRTGFKRLHPNSKTFDQFDEATGTAISNKTMDLSSKSYTEPEKDRVFYQLKKAIDAAANYKNLPQAANSLPPSRVKLPRVHVGLKSGVVLERQTLQIEAARRHAKNLGVELQVEFID